MRLPIFDVRTSSPPSSSFTSATYGDRLCWEGRLRTRPWKSFPSDTRGLEDSTEAFFSLADLTLEAFTLVELFPSLEVALSFLALLAVEPFVSDVAAATNFAALLAALFIARSGLPKEVW